MIRIYSTFIFLLSAIVMFAQELPIDPQIRYGKLENGMTYYIRQNDTEKGKVCMKFAVEIGGIHEEDYEDGMAHFVEHMAFSGGKHFTKDRLREFITGSGMGFDAGTSIDKTVYELNNIPTDKENVLDSCMLIIQDWASGLSFEDQYIEKEKSIIGQEVLYIAQTGHGIVWDIQTQLFPDSKYSKKTIIGDEKVFSQFTADMLKTFYNKWYQPQFQAVVIVGDINPEEIEEKVKTLYGAIPAPAEPTVMPKYEYGNNDKSLTAITKKDDVKNISFGIYFRQGFIPKEELGSVDSFVNDLIWGLTTNIINERLGSIIGESTGSLNVADASYGNFLMSSKEYTFCLDVEIGNNDITGSSKQLMTELARLRTHGVTKGEFDRAKMEVISEYKNRLESKDDLKNVEYANQYCKHFLTGYYTPGIDIEISLLEQILPQLSYEIINENLGQLIPTENVVMILMTKENTETPKKEELMNIYNETMAMELEAYVEQEDNEPLLSEAPKAGKIVGKSYNEELGATIFELSNGAKAIFKKTDFKKNEIIFSAIRQGGSSSFGKDDAINAKLYSEIIDLGGVGNYSKTDLQKKLAGKNIEIEGVCNPIREGLKAKTTPENLEQMLQLIYLQFTAPRTDQNAYNAMIERKRRELQSNDMFAAHSKNLNSVMFKDIIRLIPLNEEELSKGDYGKMFEKRKENFSNAGDFNFIFIGNVDADSSAEFVETYLASLPSSEHINSANEVKPIIQKGKIKDVFNHTINNPQSLVSNVYSANLDYNVRNVALVNTLTEIVNKKMFDEVREKEGSVYHISAAGEILETTGIIYLHVFFMTEKDQTEQINMLTQKIMKNMASEGPDQSLFDTALENMGIKYNDNIKSNDYYYIVLNQYYNLGIDGFTGYMDALKTITKEDIRVLTEELSKENLIEVIYTPV